MLRIDTPGEANYYRNGGDHAATVPRNLRRAWSTWTWSGQQQHRVAELVPQVRRCTGGGDVAVGPVDECPPGDRGEDVQVAGAGIVEPGEQAIDNPSRAIGVQHQEVQPAVGTTRSPARDDSRARTEVVPTATTRRRAARAPLTNRAVTSGTVNCSGWGWLERAPGLTRRCAARPV